MAKRIVKKSKPRARREYVVGYIGDMEWVYGPDDANGSARSIDKMTLLQARKLLRTLPAKGKAIFTLVPVETD